MKSAVIIVGEHASGKSRLIRQFIKPLLGMSAKQQHTVVDGRQIWIKSQTLQEAKTDISSLKRFEPYDSLILPSWPKGRGTPSLDQITNAIQAIGFRIEIVHWSRADDDSLCNKIAKKVYDAIIK